MTFIIKMIMLVKNSSNTRKPKRNKDDYHSLNLGYSGPGNPVWWGLPGAL